MIQNKEGNLTQFIMFPENLTGSQKVHSNIP